MTTETTPEFGENIVGAIYVLRPSSYVIIPGSGNTLVTIRTPKGIFLPGGGLEAGETSEGAAVREVLEECGFDIAIDERIGRADELVHKGPEYYRKRSDFFTARFIERVGEGEADHLVLWTDHTEALSTLSHGSHRWAVSAWIARDVVNNSSVQFNS